MPEAAEALDPRFEPLLMGHEREELASHSGAIYGVWSDFRLGYVNPAWFEFAARNSGEPVISRAWNLGSSLLAAMPGEVARYYEDRYTRCLETGDVFEHEYECSTPVTYRRFHQIAYPLGSAEGLLIVNSRVVSRPHDPAVRPPASPDEGIHRGPMGFAVQCAYCRRMRNFGEAARWDWVPEYVSQIPPQTSHTYCPTCLAHYWPTSTSDDV